MQVLIDTSAPGVIRLALLPAGDFVEVAEPAAGLFGALVEFLRAHQATLANLTGLAVVVGAGRFTATRIATAVGNTLAFALHIPIVAVTTPELGPAALALGSAAAGHYILPVYSAPAHINGRA